MPRTPLFVVCLLLCIVQAAVCSSRPTPATITDVTPSYGSLMGGTLVTIRGSGFERDGAEGTTTAYIGTSVCEMVEYYSTDSQIVCRAPEHQVEDSWLEVQVAVVTVDRAFYAVCTAHCYFRYHSHNTPLVYESTRSVAPGSKLNIEGYLRGQQQSHYSVLVDGQHCLLDGESDDAIIDSNWAYTNVNCTVPDVVAGRKNYTLDVTADTNDYNFGYQLNTFPSWHLSYDSPNAPHMITVHPEIKSLSLSSAAPTGGATLRVHAVGVDPEDCQNNVVTVAGLSCTVSACGAGYVDCILPAYNASATNTHSPMGMNLRMWFDISGWPSNLDVAETREPAIEVAQTSAVVGIGKDVFDKYITKIDGYFVPPRDANYTFFIRSDDQSRIELSADEHPDNLTIINDVQYYSPHFFVRDGQISDPIPLKAGERRYFRVSHEEGGGSDWVHVALMITDPTYTTSPLERELESPIERQRIQFSTNVVREQQVYTFRNVSGGSFHFYYDGQLSGSVGWDDVHNWDNRLREIVDCSSVSYSFNDFEDAQGINVRQVTMTINCPTSSTHPLATIQQTSSAQLESGSFFSVDSQRTRLASAPVRGEFRLGYKGNWTEWMAWDEHPTNVRNELVEVSELEELTSYSAGNTNDGRYIDFEIRKPFGNAELIQVDGSRLEGTNVSITATTLLEGSNELFYDPCPTEFFQRFYNDSDSFVVLTVNGIRGSCADTGFSNSACSFEFDANLTPEITAVDAPNPAFPGDSITVTGTGFVAGNATSVTVGDGACSITLLTETSIVCEFQGALAGSFPVVVLVEGRGFSVDSSAANVTVGFRVTSVSPLEVGVRGGTIITLAGDGFSSLHNDDVQVGGSSCQIIDATSTEIQCAAPALDGVASLFADITDTVLPVTVNGGTVANMTYAWNSTAVVTSTSQSVIASAHTSSLSFTLDYPQPIILSDPANNTLCPNMDAAVQVFFGHRECIKASSDGNTISCQLLRGDAELIGAQPNQIPRVSFCTEQGIAVAHTNPDVTVDIAHRVTSVTPATVGLGGGATLTFDGVGFGSTVSAVGVLFKGNGSQVACRVNAVNMTQVACVMDAVVAGEVRDADIELQINGFVAKCAPGVCQGTGNALNTSTPVVDGVDHDGTGFGSTISLNGSNFQLGSAVLVSVGGQAASVASVTDSKVVCTMPRLAAGNHAVEVLVAGVGFAVSASQLSVVYPLTLVGLSRTNGSSAGGNTVVMSGDGFQAKTSLNQVKIGTVSAVLSSATPTELTFVAPISTTPFHDSAQPVTVAVLANETSTLDSAVTSTDCNGTQCSFNYLSPVNTYRVSTISPTSGFEGTVLSVVGRFARLTANNMTASMAGVPCAINASSVSASSFECTLGKIQAGTYPLIVETESIGVIPSYALKFTSLLNVTAVSPQLASFGGGTKITLTGQGLANTTEDATVSVCGQPCNVVASSYNELVCAAPIVHTPTAYIDLPHLETQKLVGSPKGVDMSDDRAANAFDDDVESYSHKSSSPFCAVDLDLGEDRKAVLKVIRFFPRLKFKQRVEGSIFSVSTNGVDFVEVATVTSATENWNVIYLDNSTELVRVIRYSSPASVGYCDVAELEYQGYQMHNPNDTCSVSVGVFQGPAHVSLGVQEPRDADAEPTSTFSPADTVEYAASETPVVTSISPRQGSSLGGTTVTLSGTGLPTGDPTVMINGYSCDVSSASSTSIVCVTSKRTERAYLSLSVAGSDGSLAVSDPLTRFRYLDRWSERNTWLNDEPPVEGDFVVIPPDQAILLDESTPQLLLLLVQGQLIFDRKDLTLDSTYIWIQGGTMEIGTEDEPFLNKVTITLHGDRFSSIGLPHMGAKMLVVSDAFLGRAPDASSHKTSVDKGVLDIHGRPRMRTWTKVATTIPAGATELTVSEPVDFEAGELLIITHHDNFRLTEEVIVSGRSADNLTLYLESPVQYEHESVVYTIEGETVDMRVEVGIISRNIVIQGDDNSPKQKFGVHTMAALGGYYRVENAEFRNCGQAGVLGRYCTHFHMARRMDHSYVRSNSIHHSFQRACTVHATERALVQNNVAYKVNGHNFFIEDGNEMYNVLDSNLGVYTEPNYVMLKSDSKPATFWMATPTNMWRNNVAAGCTHDGYWFEPFSHPGGPSFTETMCPIGSPMYEFFNNTAHSNGVHGLRIYPAYFPHEDPCDTTSPPSPQYFYNFTSFHNGGHGIFGKKNGDLHHVNAKLVDNGNEELLWKIMKTVYREDDPHLKDSLLVNHPTNPRKKHVAGLMMPQNEFFHASGVKFVNYLDGGAISGCASCGSSTDQKQGGYTYRFDGVSFTNSSKRTLWTVPFRQIFLDLDGSLTGYENGTATPYYAFNHYPGLCDAMDETYDNGIVCNGTVAVRRLQVDAIEPRELDWMKLEIGQRDNRAKNDSLNYQVKELSGWVVPIVTDKPYFAGFRSIVDFRSMRLRLSEPEYMQYRQEMVELIWNYTDYRYAFDVTYADDTLVGAASIIDDLQVTDAFGTGKIDTVDQYWHVALTTNVNWSIPVPETGTGGPFSSSVAAIQCAPGACNSLFSSEPLYEPTLWSDVSLWCRVGTEASYGRFDTNPCEGTNTLPQAGDKVVIFARMYAILDVNPPLLGAVEVGGKIEFRDDADRVFEAASITVWGAFQVGSLGRPFTHDAVVRLHGTRSAPSVVIADTRFLGNKVLAVAGQLELHGAEPAKAWVKLATTAQAGATSLSFVNSVDWKAGDRLVLSATEYAFDQYETCVIDAVSADGRTVNLTAPLENRHFAGVVSHGTGELALRSAVGKLNRNVRVEGGKGLADNGDDNGNDNYGAHVVVMDVSLDDGDAVGRASITGVEMQHCGKQNSEHACILFKYDHTYSEDPINLVRGSSFSDGLNYAVVSEGSKGVTLSNNVIHRSFRSAVDVDDATLRMTVKDNLIVGVHRSPDLPNTWVHPFAGIFTESFSITISGNVVSGAQDAGIVFMPYECGASKRVVGNEVHGAKIGVFIVATQKYSCVELTDHLVWKAAHIGFLAVDQRVTLRLNNVAVADSHIGISANFYNPPLHTALAVTQSVVLGSTDASTCSASLTCLADSESDPFGTGCNSVFGTTYRRVGIVLPQVTNRGKTCDQDFLPTCRPITRPERLCGMGWDQRYGLPGTQHTSMVVEDVTFGHFTLDDCGYKSVALSPNPTQRNYVPEMFFEDITWSNMFKNASMYLSNKRRTSAACRVNCDALQALVAHDVDGSLTQSGRANSVLVSAANPALADGASRCLSEPDFGAIHCWNMPLRQATFENIDRDRGGRHIGPVKLERLDAATQQVVERTTFSHGPYDDGCAKRFFFGQYPFAVEGNRAYRFNISNTMPNNARLRFHSTSTLDKVLLKVYWYKDNAAMRIVRNGQEIQPLTRIPTLSDAGGSYAYADNVLTVVLQGGSTAGLQTYDIRTINEIQINLTLSISTADFFTQREQLVTTLSLLLKIPASRIKIAQVHEADRTAPTDQGTLVSDAGDVLVGGGESRRRRDAEEETTPTPGVVVQVTIVDENNSTIPTTDEEADEQLEELNAVVTTFAEVATSGELKEALGSAGLKLEAVTVVPPAGNGEAQKSVQLSVTPPPETNESNGVDTSVIIGGVVGGVALMAIALVVVLTVVKRGKATRLAEAVPQSIQSKEESVPVSASAVIHMSSEDLEEGDEVLPLAEHRRRSIRSSRGSAVAEVALSGAQDAVSTELTIEDMVDAPAVQDSAKASKRPSMFQRLKQSLRRSSNASVMPADDEAEQIQLKSVSHIRVPTVAERVHALQTHRHVSVTRTTWEYIAAHDWYHPTMSSEAATALVQDKKVGTFVVYGRQYCFLCIKDKCKVRHVAVTGTPEGFQLHVEGSSVKMEQPLLPDLQSVVEHYSEPREGVPFVLCKESENDISVNVPKRGVETLIAPPEYTQEDLGRLSRRASMVLDRSRSAKSLET
eukprot:m.345219 g.345219  ORF g.345219 m.345219 type:complete len:3928 (+) comp16139_c0_seq5:247-12030(+)